MKRIHSANLALALFTCAFEASNSSASVHYVNVNSKMPKPPYTNWVTAATNIQNAVNVASAKDVVLVTNGAYAGGITVTKPLALLSVNGPQFTFINGGRTNRCASLTNGASLTGFTLTNGYSGDGAGVWCTSTNAFLTNCVITGNSADNSGGGAYGGTLYNCTLTGNYAYYCGGACGGTLYNCTLTGNNYVASGDCTLYNCTLSGNGNPGYGADACTLYNCTLSGNSGYGAYSCTLYNCTLTGNPDSGAYSCTLYNCIVYFNASSSGANYDTSSTLNYCCTTPLPADGTGNIALDPQLASANHLSANSPCRGMGSADYATGTDIDGEPWGHPPSIGCDEYRAGAVTGPLTVSLQQSRAYVRVDYSVTFTALIDGRTTLSVWDFGDGVVVSNQPYASHAWTTPGDYAVVLRAYNESYPGGVSATGMVVAVQSVFYVAANSANPVPPYTNWITAATNIQDAVNLAPPGETIIVTNGVYPGTVNVANPLALVSVNGPQFTKIDGGGTVQCISLVDGASLTGFTLTNGHSGDGAGVECTSINAFLTNCVITGNSADNSGGGAYGGTLYHCTLSGNTGYGADGCTLYNCTLNGNSNGGAFSCTLSNCTLTGNSNGGAAGCALYNCTLTGNSDFGADGCTLYNCTLTGNTGYGADGCTLYNCTLAGNSGAGAYSCTLYNCIVYFNASSSGANYDTSSTLNYCCTTPLPADGTGNIALDPQLASASHLSANSPCRGMGSADYATGTDIDGEPWGHPPSIGCDEYRAGAVTGPLTVSLLASDAYVVVGHSVTFTALIDGRTTLSVWDFADGVVVSNQPYASHVWTTPGDYAVVLRAYNESHLGGVSATGIIRVVVPPVFYVAANSAHPVAPYSSWATAATNIQQAVDTTTLAGTEIVVSNGVYSGVVNVTNPLSLRSVNGPQFTTIDGGGTNRCAYLIDGASLTGFTLTNGVGGGAYCSSTNVFLTNCVITGNSAVGFWTIVILWGHPGPYYRSASGGGVGGGTLYNCVLTGNSADAGGGASGSILYNCTLSGNQSINTSFYFRGRWYHSYGRGGGVASCTLNNCIVYFNGENFDTTCVLNYCCTTPLPTAGIGNITNAPLFVNTNGWSNLHLRTNSPGINSGNNAYVTTTTDLDGNPRIAGGTVDMGAYEFQPCISGGQFSSMACSRLAGFSFTFSGAIVGQPYRIQTSTTLAAGSWTNLTNFTYTGPVVIRDPSAVGGPKKFYRAVSPQDVF